MTKASEDVTMVKASVNVNICALCWAGMLIATIICLLCWGLMPNLYGYDAVKLSPALRPFPDIESTLIVRPDMIFCQTAMDTSMVSWATMPEATGTVFPSRIHLRNDRWRLSIVGQESLWSEKGCEMPFNCSLWTDSTGKPHEVDLVASDADSLCMGKNMMPMTVLIWYLVAAVFLGFLCCCGCNRVITWGSKQTVSEIDVESLQLFKLAGEEDGRTQQV